MLQNDFVSTMALDMWCLNDASYNKTYVDKQSRAPSRIVMALIAHNHHRHSISQVLITLVQASARATHLGVRHDSWCNLMICCTLVLASVPRPTWSEVELGTLKKVVKTMKKASKTFKTDIKTIKNYGWFSGRSHSAAAKAGME